MSPRRLGSFIVGLAVVTGGVAGAQVSGVGPNGGVRLVLHCSGAVSLPQGKPTVNPCESPPALIRPGDVVTGYDDEPDTMMVWVYLYHPCRFAVRGVGFGIRYEGVRVVTSGTCADIVYQDGQSMGTWAQNGSEIAFTWKSESPTLAGRLAPVSWFLLARQQRDGFFEVYEGRTKMAGFVADSSQIPVQDPIWAYGRIGLGSVEGSLPIEDPERVAGAWGAVQVGAR